MHGYVHFEARPDFGDSTRYVLVFWCVCWNAHSLLWKRVQGHRSRYTLWLMNSNIVETTKGGYRECLLLGARFVIINCRNHTSRFDTAVLTNRIELTTEYKHLDEMTKLMILKLRDIHQQLTTEGKEWFGKREEICLCFVFL